MAPRPPKPTRMLAAKALSDAEKCSIHTALFRMGVSPGEAMREHLRMEAIEVMKLYDAEFVGGLALRRLEMLWEMAIAEGNVPAALATVKCMLDLFAIPAYSAAYTKVKVANQIAAQAAEKEPAYLEGPTLPPAE